MRKRYGMEYEDYESFSPWETYSDLYCGLLLVFVLLFFFAIYQYIDTREKNIADTVALQESMKDEQASVLAIYKADLKDRIEELDAQQLLIDEQTLQLLEQQEELDTQRELVISQQEELNVQQELLDSQQVELGEKQTLLDAQQVKLEEQQTLLEEQQELLDNQAVQIEQIVGVRGELIEELNRALTASQIAIQADLSTGAIAVESNILFASDSNELREEGKSFFQKFIPIYLEVLLQPQFQEYIAEIIVEGHTDNTGTYLHNLELSQARALSVADYFFDESSVFLDSDSVKKLKTLITLNGCADKNPIYHVDGTVDAERSRRVEIKFRLKDQEMIQEMDAILNNE